MLRKYLAKSKDVIRLRELLQNTQFTASLDSIPCYEEDADSAPLEEREMLAGKVFPPKRAKLFRERIWGGNIERVAVQGVFCRDDTGRNPTTRPEVSTVWVESLRSDPGNIVSKQTADIYKLQNKARLHDVLTAYSYGTLLPKLFRNPQEIAPTQYPVVLKRSVGASGYGIFIINSAKELAKEMDISNINSNKNERIAPYQARNSVGWIIEEAVVGGLEYMVHYIRTNSGRPFIKCTVYKKRKSGRVPSFSSRVRSTSGQYLHVRNAT